MKRTRGRVIDVDSLTDLDRRLASGATSMRGWQVRNVDLRERGEQLRRVRLGGASFLGCQFADGDERMVEAAGALVLPVISSAPVDVYRSTLYSPEELYDDPTYAASLDGRAYAWSQRPAGPDHLLAQTLHDHAIDEALTAWTAPQHLVGVMGGHAWQRGEPEYLEAVRLGHSIGGSAVVATGGGPGAMEAASLGARLARRPFHDLDEAVAMLAAVPSFRPSVEEWVRAAFSVCDRFDDPAPSLGIPTWHYGHEPSHVFATAIAKYFGNPSREAVLLEVCDGGIVFLPGAAGTIQEVFQDACENYYADESSVAPMVLVGATYWTQTLPAWPLLQALARGRAMEGHVHLVNSAADAAALLRVSPPAARE